MPKVTLKKGQGKHRLADGSYCLPGQEIEISEAALANIGDKFERVMSAGELAELAEQRAEEEAKAAEKAKAKAEAAAKDAEKVKRAAEKTGAQGKG
ncbi:MAG: hypothetical protein ACR2RE_07590 [Geminicoccaceae bacterium]